METAIFCTFLLFLLAIPTAKAGSFWYFDDLHYDPTYGTANESCLEAKKPSKFNRLGSYYCDAPWALVEDAIVKMQGHMPAPNFIVWAGDTGHHPLTETTVLNPTTLFQAMQNVTRVLQREFPDIRVLPMLGNHDWLPKNKLPPQGSSGDLYDQYANLFLQAGWLSQEEANVFKKAGYFATTLSGTNDQLKILVLNTNLYLKKNTATSGDDPAGQFQFMRDQLNMAKRNNQVVYVFTHVPVGNQAIRSPYDETLVDIIADYEDVIISMHGAHEHMDRFRLIYKKGSDTPVAYQVITPAVTPWVGGRLYPRNPSFASFHYDNSNFAVQDMRLYYLDLAHVDDSEESKRWVQLYSFGDTYGKPISITSLSDILDKLKTDEDFFQEYYRRMYVNIGTEFLKSCDAKCQKTELCLIQYPKNSDLEPCLKQAQEDDSDDDPNDPDDENGTNNGHSIHQMALTATAVAFLWRAA